MAFAKEPYLHLLSSAQIERRMELVRVVSHNTHKRMVSCLQGHIGADAEKRHVSHQARRNETFVTVAAVYLFVFLKTNQIIRLSQDV